jgi:hypothetical protein
LYDAADPPLDAAAKRPQASRVVEHSSSYVMAAAAARRRNHSARGLGAEDSRKSTARGASATRGVSPSGTQRGVSPSGTQSVGHRVVPGSRAACTPARADCGGDSRSDGRGDGFYVRESSCGPTTTEAAVGASHRSAASPRAAAAAAANRSMQGRSPVAQQRSAAPRTGARTRISDLERTQHSGYVPARRSVSARGGASGDGGGAWGADELDFAICEPGSQARYGTPPRRQATPRRDVLVREVRDARHRRNPATSSAALTAAEVEESPIPPWLEQSPEQDTPERMARDVDLNNSPTPAVPWTCQQRTLSDRLRGTPPRSRAGGGHRDGMAFAF